MLQPRNESSPTDVEDWMNCIQVVELIIKTRELPARSAKKKAKHLYPLSREIWSRFPAELHDCILDHLHDDRKTLAACSLVCKSWNVSSTYRLFHDAATIRVHQQNYRQLLEVLAGQRLNVYIGRLHLIGYVYPWSDGDWSFQFNDRLGAFMGLPCVKFLCLEYHHTTILPRFSAAIAQNFSGVTDLELRSIQLDSCTIFFQVIAALPLLRRLALVQMRWYNAGVKILPEQKLSSMDAVPRNLVDLVIDRLTCSNTGAGRSSKMAPMLLWLTSHLSIRRLTIGKLHAHLATPLLTGLLGPGLSHLIIHADHAHGLDLSRAALRTFEITNIPCDRTRPKNIWVAALLSRSFQRHSTASPPTPVPQRLALFLDLLDQEGLDTIYWPEIADVFTEMASPREGTAVSAAPAPGGPGMGTGLQRVDIFVSQFKTWAEDSVPERLPAPRSYMLRTGQGKRQYTLDMFG
ncbi:hypothetical protein DFH08DRAFT_1039929 [Mycena albidolilacea]|uniref:F-box domain-containing protein n=1 Tax=Mycena albidolilacea TaxID=1033008 RepID=A0AAD6ZCA2_9AGAR|nr:hypothetical protein DFH08DRAFT_1039929 [Mycena albidolilacea]